MEQNFAQVVRRGGRVGARVVRVTDIHRVFEGCGLVEGLEGLRSV